jgi:uncharacterized repeat protein (TIGR03803 family)
MMKYRYALAISLASVASLHSQTMEDIHNFRHDGKVPLGRLLLKDGDYYGTTSSGGLSLYSSGTIFRHTPAVPSGAAANHRILNHIQSGSPDAGLTLGADGNFYGTMRFSEVGSQNPSTGRGGWFKMLPSGSFTWIFRGGTNGYSTPTGELVEHSPGVFFGQSKNINSTFDSLFIRISETPFSLTSIRTGNGNTEGSPHAALLLGADSKYYGGTERRLLNIDPANANDSVVLHSSDANGAGFQWGVTQGPDGTLYGVGETSGTANAGVVWKMNIDGTGYAVLHSFDGAAGGENPRCRLVLHTDGALYGTTAFGGVGDFGTVFKITTGGTFTKLHDFTGTEGSRPRTLISGRNGGFAGVAEFGGSTESGTIFEVATDGTLTTLHHFGSVGGFVPSGPLLLASDGNFYGTAAWGGRKGRGAIYRYVPGANPRIEEVYGIGDLEGRHPFGPLREGADGALYGFTKGTLAGFDNSSAFRVTKDGQFTLLRYRNSFSSTTLLNGYSLSPMEPRGDGSFFGVGAGAIYRVTAEGKHFDFVNDSVGGQLFPEADGSFLSVGSSGGGTVIRRIQPGGTITTVNSDATVLINTPVIRGVDGAFWGIQFQNSTGTLIRFANTGAAQRITLTGESALVDSESNVRNLVEREPGVFYVVRQDTRAIGEMAQRLLKIEAATGAVTTVLSDIGKAPNGERRANYTQFAQFNFGTPALGGMLVTPSGTLTADDNLLFTIPQDVVESGGRITKFTLPARTGTAPLATTGAASGATFTTASLAGEVNPQGAQTYAWIEFGLTTAYGIRGNVVDAGNGTAPVAVTAALGTLRSNTVYHYRTVAYSAAGVAYGADQTFTTATNALPVANPDTVNIRLANPLQPATFTPLSNDTDGDNDTLTILAVTEPRKGSLIRTGNSFTYTPNAAVSPSPFNAQGDSFNYLISDGKGGESSVTVTIAAVTNATPVAGADTILIRGKETVQIQPLLNDTDADGDTLVIQNFQQGAGGSVTKTGNTLNYTPGKTFTGNDTFTYTITDGFGGQTNGTINVVNPFIPLAGSYEPLIGDDDGIATLKVTTGGLLTGKLKLGTKTYPLKGLIGFDGAYNQIIKRKGLRNLLVSFQFTTPGQVATISGTVDGLPITSDVKLTTTIPAPAFPAKYTILLTPGTIPSPLDAYGWATASLSTKGALSMSGLTPDGKAFSLGGKMRVDTSVVLFKPGSYIARFSFAEAADSDLSGTFRWTRAAVTKGSIFLGAIDTTFALGGSKFTPPAKDIRTLTYTAPLSATGQLRILDGGIDPAIQRLFNIDLKDKAVIAPLQTNTELVKLTHISRTDGRIEGTFKHPTLPKNPVIKFRGVQLQTAAGGTGPNKAFGLFTTPTAAGSFEFTPL